jgi:DNA repair exonuclease SbcCD ATPase subunit
MMEVAEVWDTFKEAKTRKQIAQETIARMSALAESCKREAELKTKARYVLVEVAKNTQGKFKEKVESLVTMAIQSIYDRPFQFKLEFERKRNKMECSFVVTEIVGGKERVYTDPENDMGGGIIDIISFALRVVMWSLDDPPSRNVLILDEPMKNLGNLVSLGGQVLREISHKLNIQIILVTHDEELMDIADVSYEVLHDGNESHVVLVKGDIIERPKRNVKIKR